MALPLDPLEIHDDEHYKKEMAEFEKFHDAIKDIDYYKAETEAARNGQDAAMEFANVKKWEAHAAKQDLQHLQLSRKLERIATGIFVLVLVAAFLTYIIFR